MLVKTEMKIKAGPSRPASAALAVAVRYVLAIVLATTPSAALVHPNHVAPVPRQVIARVRDGSAKMNTGKDVQQRAQMRSVYWSSQILDCMTAAVFEHSYCSTSLYNPVPNSLVRIKSGVLETLGGSRPAAPASFSMQMQGSMPTVPSYGHQSLMARFHPVSLGVHVARSVVTVELSMVDPITRRVVSKTDHVFHLRLWGQAVPSTWQVYRPRRVWVGQDAVLHRAYKLFNPTRHLHIWSKPWTIESDKLYTFVPAYNIDARELFPRAPQDTTPTFHTYHAYLNVLRALQSRHARCYLFQPRFSGTSPEAWNRTHSFWLAFPPRRRLTVVHLALGGDSTGAQSATMNVVLTRVAKAVLLSTQAQELAVSVPVSMAAYSAQEALFVYPVIFVVPELHRHAQHLRTVWVHNSIQEPVVLKSAQVIVHHPVTGEEMPSQLNPFVTAHYTPGTVIDVNATMPLARIAFTGEPLMPMMPFTVQGAVSLLFQSAINVGLTRVLAVKYEVRLVPTMLELRRIATNQGSPNNLRSLYPSTQHGSKPKSHVHVPVALRNVFQTPLHLLHASMSSAQIGLRYAPVPATINAGSSTTSFDFVIPTDAQINCADLALMVCTNASVISIPLHCHFDPEIVRARWPDWLGAESTAPELPVREVGDIIDFGYVATGASHYKMFQLETQPLLHSRPRTPSADPAAARDRPRQLVIESITTDLQDLRLFVDTSKLALSAEHASEDCDWHVHQNAKRSSAPASSSLRSVLRTPRQPNTSAPPASIKPPGALYGKSSGVSSKRAALKLAPTTKAFNVSLALDLTTGEAAMRELILLLNPREAAAARASLIFHTNIGTYTYQVQYRAAHGGLQLSPAPKKPLILDSAFPGRSSSVALSMASKYDFPVAVTRAWADDPRFTVELNDSVAYLTADMQSVATITFDPAKADPCQNYLSDPQTAGVGRRITSISPELEDIEIDALAERRRVWTAMVQSGANRVRTSVTVDTSALQGVHVAVQASLVQPSVLVAPQKSFPMTQIGAWSQISIAVHNPSSFPIRAELLTPLPASPLRDALPLPEFLRSVYKAPDVLPFSLPKAGHTVIPPNSSAALGPVYFQPSAHGHVHAVIPVRNSLTLVELVDVHAVAGSSLLSLSQPLPQPPEDVLKQAMSRPPPPPRPPPPTPPTAPPPPSMAPEQRAAHTSALAAWRAAPALLPKVAYLSLVATKVADGVGWLSLLLGASSCDGRARARVVVSNEGNVTTTVTASLQHDAARAFWLLPPYLQPAAFSVSGGASWSLRPGELKTVWVSYLPSILRSDVDAGWLTLTSGVNTLHVRVLGTLAGEQVALCHAQQAAVKFALSVIVMLAFCGLLSARLRQSDGMWPLSLQAGKAAFTADIKSPRDVTFATEASQHCTNRTAVPMAAKTSQTACAPASDSAGRAVAQAHARKRLRRRRRRRGRGEVAESLLDIVTGPSTAATVSIDALRAIVSERYGGPSADGGGPVSGPMHRRSCSASTSRFAAAGSATGAQPGLHTRNPSTMSLTDFDAGGDAARERSTATYHMLSEAYREARKHRSACSEASEGSASPPTSIATSSTTKLGGTEAHGGPSSQGPSRRDADAAASDTWLPRREQQKVSVSSSRMSYATDSGDEDGVSTRGGPVLQPLANLVHPAAPFSALEGLQTPQAGMDAQSLSATSFGGASMSMSRVIDYARHVYGNGDERSFCGGSQQQASQAGAPVTSSYNAVFADNPGLLNEFRQSAKPDRARPQEPTFASNAPGAAPHSSGPWSSSSQPTLDPDAQEPHHACLRPEGNIWAPTPQETQSRQPMQGPALESGAFDDPATDTDATQTMAAAAAADQPVLDLLTVCSGLSEHSIAYLHAMLLYSVSEVPVPSGAEEVDAYVKALAAYAFATREYALLDQISAMLRHSAAPLTLPTAAASIYAGASPARVSHAVHNTGSDPLADADSSAMAVPGSGAGNPLRRPNDFDEGPYRPFQRQVMGSAEASSLHQQATSAISSDRRNLLAASAAACSMQVPSSAAQRLPVDLYGSASAPYDLETPNAAGVRAEEAVHTAAATTWDDAWMPDNSAATVSQIPDGRLPTVHAARPGQAASMQRRHRHAGPKHFTQQPTHVSSSGVPEFAASASPPGATNVRRVACSDSDASEGEMLMRALEPHYGASLCDDEEPGSLLRRLSSPLEEHLSVEDNISEAQFRQGFEAASRSYKQADRSHALEDDQMIESVAPSLPSSLREGDAARHEEVDPLDALLYDG